MDKKEKFDYEELKRKTLEQLRSGKSLFGKDGAFALLLKDILEAALQGEMEGHLDEEQRTSGNQDLLGTYVSESEGANFWLGVLTNLQQRGVSDILIACIDGLKGFAEAIASIYPATEVQVCTVHQIRNSIKYVASKDQKPFMTDLKMKPSIN